MNSVESIKYRKTLEAGGVPPEQAQAHADALAEVLESMASKDWVRAELKQQLGDLKFDMLKWMVSLFIAQTSITIGTVIALIRYLPH
ncbi:hypothetical protein GJ699_01550 [Duganella sp. FT80W]|uniref:DUF1640 domain-containing protein n=1 Tax=Duganella guangzhouensis TaxID=2666084 RepID=A0A6I2KUE1_9BURK|nr:hypothetical protein [Duganella guangzhouensis]MRW88667.1 hypothetical protein [Duganella guangzhouensis]